MENTAVNNNRTNTDLENNVTCTMNGRINDRETSRRLIIIFTCTYIHRGGSRGRGLQGPSPLPQGSDHESPIGMK